jgi:hypothetical protein
VLVFRYEGICHVTRVFSCKVFRFAFSGVPRALPDIMIAHVINKPVDEPFLIRTR